MNRSAQKSPHLKRWLSLSERILVHSEISQLHKILWEDEHPEFAAQYMYGGFICLIVPTNYRLLLIDHNLINVKIDSFAYARIDTVEYDKGFMYGWLNLMLPERKVELKYIRRKSIKQLCEVITGRCAKYANVTSESEIVTESTDTETQEIFTQEQILSHLERLVTLNRAGALTELEFSQQKEILLSKQPRIVTEQKRIPKPSWSGVSRPSPEHNE